MLISLIGEILYLRLLDIRQKKMVINSFFPELPELALSVLVLAWILFSYQSYLLYQSFWVQKELVKIKIIE